MRWSHPASKQFVEWSNTQQTVCALKQCVGLSHPPKQYVGWSHPPKQRMGLSHPPEQCVGLSHPSKQCVGLSHSLKQCVGWSHPHKLCVDGHEPKQQETFAETSEQLRTRIRETDTGITSTDIHTPIIRPRIRTCISTNSENRRDCHARLSHTTQAGRGS